MERAEVMRTVRTAVELKRPAVQKRYGPLTVAGDTEKM